MEALQRKVKQKRYFISIRKNGDKLPRSMLLKRRCWWIYQTISSLICSSGSTASEAVKASNSGSVSARCFSTSAIETARSRSSSAKNSASARVHTVFMFKSFLAKRAPIAQCDHYLTPAAPRRYFSTSPNGDF